MIKPTKILSDEHKNILFVIDILQKKCADIESGKDIDEKFFGKAVDFIKNYADKFHHSKEEDILFVKISGHKKMHCDPTKQMLHEHVQGREFVKGMREALKNKDKESLMKNARSYGELLQDHIFKEDNILYQMADEAFSEAEQKEIAEKFAKVAELKFDQKEWD